MYALKRPRKISQVFQKKFADFRKKSYLCSTFLASPMTYTNPNILTADERITTAMLIAGRLSETPEKQLLISALAEAHKLLFDISYDFADVKRETAEQARKLYEVLIKAQANEKCIYIDEDALRKGAYSYDIFEKMLREACERDARSLGIFLHKYERIGYLDFHGQSKKKIFEYLRSYFPTMRPYSYANFAANF